MTPAGARGVRIAAVAAAALLAASLLLPGLGTAPFDDPGEGQHAEIAREAWTGGHWLGLRLNGVRYLDKPPLLYAIAASGFSLWGPGESAARMGALLGAVAAVAGTALLGARLLGAAGGLAAGTALLGCALFAAFGRYVRPETLFVAAIQWGFTGLLVVSARGKILGGAALGLAALAKDPLGLAGPIAAIGLARRLAGRLRPVSSWLPRGALVLALLLGLGWYALAAIASPGFVWYTVVDNHLLNAARLRGFPDEDVPLSALEFLTVSLMGAFPWTIGAAGALADLWRRRAWRDPAETAWVALALWALSVIGVFAVLPFKLPHYGLPAYPAIALLAARWWMDPARGRRAIALHAVAFAAVAALCGAAAASDGRAFTDAVLSAADVATRKEAVAAGAAAAPTDAPAMRWDELRPVVSRTALVFAVGAAGLAVAGARRAPRLALALAVSTMLASVPAVAAGLGQVATGRAVRLMAAEVARRAAPGVLVLHEGPIEQSGALEFYSGRRPVLVEATRSVLGFGARFPDAAEAFWDRDRLAREWATGRPLLLVTPRPPERSVVAALPAERVRLLLAHNGRRLYESVPPLAAAAAAGVR